MYTKEELEAVDRRSIETRRTLYDAAANKGQTWTPPARAVYNHNAATGRSLDIKISDRELRSMDREQIAELVEAEMAKAGQPAAHTPPAPDTTSPSEWEMQWRRDVIAANRKP
jgi:hypothetical protein